MSAINNTTSPALRTTIQGAVAAGILRLIETLPEPDLVINDSDKIIIGTVLLGAVSLVQNFVENRMGRAILLPQRTNPPMPEAADDAGHSDTVTAVVVLLLIVCVFLLVL
jgi:hypothetical protein